MATVLSFPRITPSLGKASRASTATGTLTGDSLATREKIVGQIYSWAELHARVERLSRSDRADQLVLYRHGATNYNDRNLVSGQHDTALSDDGRRQAEALATTIPAHLDLIVCSGLSRAVQTMELAIPAVRRQGIPILADARLNEVHLGDLQGRRRRHLPEFEAGDLDYAPPNGESYRRAAARVFSAIVDIFSILADQDGASRTAAVFCHAGVLRIVATLTSASEDPKDVFRKTLGNAEKLEIHSDAVRVAEYWEKNARA